MTSVMGLESGASVTLGAVIARAGEGSIYEVVGHREWVAKIFHPDLKDLAAKRAKVAAMAGSAPAGVVQSDGFVVLTWPLHYLQGEDDSAGYIMSRIDTSNAVEIHALSNPANRNNPLPSAPQWTPHTSWHHLVNVAANLSLAVETAHRVDAVIGDFQERNILVNDTTRVTLVDIDSIQFTDPAGQQFLCAVGRPEFSAPELAGVDLTTTPRHQPSDLFALAVHIHLLLMAGNHPFLRGDWTGPGDQPDAMTLARSGQWAGGPGSQLHTHRLAPSLDFLPPDVQRLFVRAFTDGARDPSARPTAAEWGHALRALQVTTCPRGHQIPVEADPCPWCIIDTERAARRHQRATAPIGAGHTTPPPLAPAASNPNLALAAHAALGDTHSSPAPRATKPKDDAVAAPDARKGRAISTTLIVLMVALVAGYALFGLVTRHTWMNGDPREGVRVTLSAMTSDGATASLEELQQSAQILLRRLDAAGIAGASATVDGVNLVVMVPGASDELTTLIAPGHLALRPVVQQLPLSGIAEIPGQPAAPIDHRADQTQQITAEKELRQSGDSSDLIVALKSMSERGCEGNDLLAGNDDENRPLVTCSTDRQSVYLLDNAIITGDAVTDAESGFNSDTGQFVVDLTLSSQAAVVWADFTAANLGTQIASVVDSRVVGAPVINEPIIGGRVEIAGQFSAYEARDLAAALITTPLPLTLAVASLAPTTIPGVPASTTMQLVMVGVGTVVALTLIGIAISLALRRVDID